MHNQESQRRRLNLSACLGGLGLLGCIACCTLPILGVIGIGGGAAAFFKILEPLSAGLFVLGAVAAAVVLLRRRRSRCAPLHTEGATCSADGSCGRGPDAGRLSGAAER
jgi:hypothetical protein